MMGEGRGVNFPVKFFDGEREINIGSVRIHPSLEFKTFQSGLSYKIGISPNQISVYLVDNQNRSRIPVTGKMNFAAVANETECFFRVVLKRSRRNRRPRPKHSGIDFGDYSPENEFPTSPEKRLLLRRSQPDLLSGYALPRYDQILQPDYFAERLRLQIQRDNYSMVMMESNGVNLDLDSISGTESSPVAHDRRFCQECESGREKGIQVPFHCCVFDAVVEGFRSPTAGPIARPRRAVP